jgi:ribonuclease HI
VKATVHVDGGARGNPGPAAAAAVIAAPDGTVLDEASVRLGETTNNMAEYRGLLLGLERARALGVQQPELVMDSELVVNQVNGRYRVRSSDLAPLHRAVIDQLQRFDAWTIRAVRRADNARADALVNAALDSPSS